MPIRSYCVLLLARKSQNLASIRVFEPVSDGDLTTDPGVDPRPGSDQGIIDRAVDREVAGLFPALEPKLRFPMGTTPEEELRMQVAQEETKRAGLDHQRAESQARLESLRRRLKEIQAEPVVAPCLPKVESQSVPAMPGKKVKLFRSLFRGREEVFPTRFVSRRTSRPGLGGRLSGPELGRSNRAPRWLPRPWPSNRPGHP